MSKVPSTVEEWLGSDNTLGTDMWYRKYQYVGVDKDGNEVKETFPEWIDRISAGDEDLKDLIVAKKFLFGGRILANRGLEKIGKKVSFSNCYVMQRPDDCIESIFDTARDLARTYSYGGGCGVDISNLSPRGAKINNASKETSGSVSFMDLYSMVTDLIGQN
jgi:ribonucleoside-diphosphate reductase alpha chain